MEISNSKTRKKLKTRKHHDRLRSTCTLLKVKGASEDKFRTGVNACKIANITSDRLSLKVFPRTVNSETLTRPLLGKLKLWNPDLRKMNKFQDYNEVTQYPTAGDFLFNHSTNKNTDFFNNKKQTCMSNDYNEVSKFNVDHEELMAEISSNLEKQFPHLISEDIMADSKKKLQELYLMNHENKKFQSEWQNNSQSPQATASNKLISLKENHCLVLSQQSLKCCSESSNSHDQSRSKSAEISFSPFEPSLQANINILDTPEYRFFPHKLK